MNNSFGKTFLAALLAVIVAGLLPFMLFGLIMMGVGVMLSPKETVVKPRSVLVVDLENSIVDCDRFNYNLPDAMRGKAPVFGLPLLSVLRGIEAAAGDDNIAGIYINPVGPGSITLAAAEELRAALARFKESGKFVVSYSEAYGLGDYYIASVSDKVFMNPAGELQWWGFSMPVVFFKGTLDKLGIEAQVVRHGTFKSAVEPYISDRMSDANRLQMERLTNSLWHDIVLKDVAASRGLEPNYLDRCATDLLVDLPEATVELGFVDGLIYENEMLSLLGDLVENGPAALTPAAPEGDAAPAGEKKIYDTPEMVSLEEYCTYAASNDRNNSKNKVAVIYADGDIVDGDSGDNAPVVSTAGLVRKLTEARKDKNVKAVVLRVNSPGGSALASESMWREVERLKAEKPVVVSMGQYAASGGYYISCPGDIIVADRSTLTGSIGVFGLLFNLQKGLRDKAGITVDVARSNPSADMLSQLRSLTPAERAFLQKGVEEMYATFVSRVAEGRNLTPERVDEIGQGRVWIGTDAKEIGLIDGFGGLTEAIALAADRGEVADDFRIVEIGRKENKWQYIIREVSKELHLFSARGDDLDAEVARYFSLSRLLRRNGTVQALMPFEPDMSM